MLLWHTILEDWSCSHLNALALLVPDRDELAAQIEQSFRDVFDRWSDPFLQHACLTALERVNFKRIAEQLLLTACRQRQHEAKRAQKNGGPA
jgi:hypothetical protein